MEATVIQEVANQLGLAADQAGQFITEHLPAFASMKVVQAWSAIGGMASVVVLFCAISLIALAIAVKQRNADRLRIKEQGYSYCQSRKLDDYTPFFVSIVSAAVALMFMVFFVMLLSSCIPTIIGWQNYPDAMLIDMAIKAVG